MTVKVADAWIWKAVVRLQALGFKEVQRQGRKATRLADADYRVSLQHPELGWAHVSRYDRAGRSQFEVVLYPEVLGTRTAHGELEGAIQRLEVIRERASHGGGKVWSERKPRNKRDLPWR